MTVTKSYLFRLAHQYCKRIRQPGDDYRVTFGLCLQAFYEKYKHQIPVSLKRVLASDLSDDNIVAVLGVGDLKDDLKAIAKRYGNAWHTYKAPAPHVGFAPKFYELPYKYNDVEKSWTVQLKVVKELMNNEFFASAVKAGDITFLLLKNPVIEAPKSTYNNTKKAQRAAKTRQNRSASRLLGVQSKLTGTSKQIGWAEELRLNFLETITDDNAYNFVANASFAQSAKFWLDNKDLPHAELERLMAQVIVATSAANEIGAGNEGYDKQVMLRAIALMALGQEP